MTFIVATRGRLSASLVLAALTITGCGSDADDGEPVDSASQSTPTSAAPPVEPSADDADASASAAPDPRARKELKAAILSLLRANTGSYELDVPFGDGLSIRETGTYRINPLAFESVREQISPEGTVRIAYRGVGDETWFRMDALTSDQGAQQGWPCWVNYDDIAALPQFPVELTQGPSGQPPVAVVSASWGMGEQRTGPSSMEGTTDLATALGLVSSKLLVAAGIDPQGDAVAPATFELDGGILTGYAVPLAQLPAAIDGAGGSLPPELGDLGAMPGSITTHFTRLGSPVDVAPPPVGERVTVTGADDYEAAMKACGRS